MGQSPEDCVRTGPPVTTRKRAPAAPPASQWPRMTILMQGAVSRARLYAHQIARGAILKRPQEPRMLGTRHAAVLAIFVSGCCLGLALSIVPMSARQAPVQPAPNQQPGATPARAVLDK